MTEPTTEPLTPSDMVQIRMAAQGLISGALCEWPLLDKALKKSGINLHGGANRSEIVPICQDLLKQLEENR